MLRIFLVLILAIACNIVYAQPKIVGVFGKTASAKPYYKKLGLIVPKLDEKALHAKHYDLPKKIISFNPYPMNSALTVGKVATRKVHFNLSCPLFVVGFDAGSIKWLQAYQKQLQKIHAQGVVVNFKNAGQLARLQKGFPGEILAPVSGDGVTKIFGIKHYPALITHSLIEQ